MKSQQHRRTLHAHSEVSLVDFDILKAGGSKCGMTESILEAGIGRQVQPPTTTMHSLLHFCYTMMMSCAVMSSGSQTN
jgi:hypothetical protein